ncbi:hypothetical protein FACS189449_10610 [Alphaproteobacteria bacterium]|nr:hypothetical protein FACS189449_10610 [Alphaproteobacteria bacterium]
MKQVLTPEDINCLEEKLKAASPAPWKVVEEENVETAWVSPDIDGNPIALFDYRSGEQNKADAHFVVHSRNYMDVLISEIRTLRRRILELIQSNNVEVQKRIDLQTELSELKKLMRDADESK